MTPATLPLRAGDMPSAELIDLYMAHYAGRDTSRVQRLGWWRARLGEMPFEQVSDDHVHAALEALSADPARRWAGTDADGAPIFKAKRKPLSASTINRYAASLAAVFTWAIRRRIAPKGWDHPCRRVERRPEPDGKVRFLSEDERARLLAACKAASWPKLYLLVLLGLTTGARKSELLGLRWQDIDLERGTAMVMRSKNGDAKVLPLTPPVLEQLREHATSPLDALVFASRRCPAQAYSFEPMWIDTLKAAKVRHFRFHDLRHSCASRLAQEGATLLEIADLLGHRQLQMTKRYSHLASSHRSALVNRVMGELR